jgi:putative DNA primase/helicase
MTADIESVREVLAGAADVDLPEGMALPPQDGEDPGFAPDGGPDEGDEADFGAPPAPPEDGDGIDWQAIERAAALPLNDFGNGLRLALHFGADLIFIPRVGWFRWDGSRWAEDPDDISVRQLVHKMGDLIARETLFIRPSPKVEQQAETRDALQLELDDLDQIKAHTPEQKQRRADIRKQMAEIDEAMGRVQDKRAQRTRHAKNAGNTNPIKNMMTEGGVTLARRLDEMDANPLAVACKNGVLQFSVARVGGVKRAEVQLVPHDRGQLITKLMDVAYDARAHAPRFHGFLSQIMPDPDIQAFLQRVFGLSMLGLTEQMLCFFFGDGANGKSVLTDLIARILGDYAASAKIESLTGSNRRGGGDATPDLVPMIGARFLRASEPEKGVQWQEGLIKELTGGEPILVRALNKDFVEVRPIFKLVISGNHRPEFRGDDHGIWRRIKLVPFAVQIPEAERIAKQELDDLLFAEAPGVLNWMVEGALNYLEIGLQEPSAVRDATAALRAELDYYGTFLLETCVVSGDPRDKMPAADLVNAFHFWLAMRGEGQFRDRTVAMGLKDKSRKYRSPLNGQQFTELKSGGRMFYTGIRLNDVFAKDWQQTPKDPRGRPIVVTPTGSDGQYGGSEDGP